MMHQGGPSRGLQEGRQATIRRATKRPPRQRAPQQTAEQLVVQPPAAARLGAVGIGRCRGAPAEGAKVVVGQRLARDGSLGLTERDYLLDREAAILVLRPRVVSEWRSDDDRAW